MKHTFFFLALCVTTFAVAQNYTLVWNEDFTDASLDTQVWNIEVDDNGGYNNELQYYCEQAVSLGVEPSTGKQCLVITATKEPYLTRDCTSGRVNTKNNLYYTYGRIDARIKFPNTANGLWPAFWQMGNNYDLVGWALCGEADIVELGHKDAFAAGTQDRLVNGAVHVGPSDGVWHDNQLVTWPYSLEDTFHIFTMIWTPTSIDMYIDKDSHPELGAYFHTTLEHAESAEYDRWVIFSRPNFLIANLAVGGDFPALYALNQITALKNGPQSMYIDWIRIYQRGDTGESFVCPTPSDEIEPEPEDWQAIEPVVANPSSTRKYLYNGQIYISRGGAVYTADGRLLMQP